MHASSLSGAVAIVTGANRGIGLAIARALVADGARVCVTARKQDALNAAVADLGDPDCALGIAGSSDDPAHQRDTVARAIDTFGPRSTSSSTTLASTRSTARCLRRDHGRQCRTPGILSARAHLPERGHLRRTSLLGELDDRWHWTAVPILPELRA